MFWSFLRRAERSCYRVNLHRDTDLGSVSPLMVKVMIGGGEADPRLVPRGNFTPEPTQLS